MSNNPFVNKNKSKNRYRQPEFYRLMNRRPSFIQQLKLLNNINRENNINKVKEPIFKNHEDLQRYKNMEINRNNNENNDINKNDEVNIKDNTINLNNISDKDEGELIKVLLNHNTNTKDNNIIEENKQPNCSVNKENKKQIDIQENNKINDIDNLSEKYERIFNYYNQINTEKYLNNIQPNNNEQIDNNMIKKENIKEEESKTKQNLKQIERKGNESEDSSYNLKLREIKNEKSIANNYIYDNYHKILSVLSVIYLFKYFIEDHITPLINDILPRNSNNNNENKEN